MRWTTTPRERRRRRVPMWTLVVLALVGALAAGCGSGGSDNGGGGTGTSGGSADKQYVIGFVSSSLSDPFWAAETKGAKAADAAMDNVKVVTAAATRAQDFSALAPLVQNIMTQNPDVIVVPGIAQLEPVLRQVDVPVIFYADGLPDSTIPKSTVITDNLAAGRAAGEFLKRQMGGRGKLAILDILRGTYPLLDQRVQGVLEAIRGSDIQVVTQQNTMCDTARTVSIMQNVLTRTPDVSGVFAACGTAAQGAVQAVEAAGKSGQIRVVGYDGSDPEIANIKAGKQDATVAQFPVRMGRIAIETAAKVAAGESVEANIDTGHLLITKANASNLPKDE